MTSENAFEDIEPGVSPPYRIATRGSKLALYQAHTVKKKMESFALYSEIKVIRTLGDREQQKSVLNIGGKGVFTKEVEQELAARRADIAVHSLKDLPVHLHRDFQVTCVLTRDYPGDFLITRSPLSIVKQKSSLKKEDLKSLIGLRVGTDSLRRRGFIAQVSSAIQLLPIRGNIDTRLNKLENSQYDALILAEASMTRLAFTDRYHCYLLDRDWFIPSSCQGVIGIETRRVDSRLNNSLQPLNCHKTMKCINIERGVMKGLGADCQMPVGVFAELKGEKILCSVAVLNLVGEEVRVRKAFSIERVEDDIIGELIEDLKSGGVNKLLKEMGLKLLN